jgi:uncharacterized protein with FMN-binding domain
MMDIRHAPYSKLATRWPTITVATRRQTTTAVGGAILLAVSLGACAAEAPESTPSSANTPDTPAAPTASASPIASPAAPATPEEDTMTSPTADSATTYRDGEYSATGWYGSLPSHHDVTLTIDDDVVTAVEITTPAEDETSLGYQQRFAAALPEAIVGRSIDELAVDRLAGSSGCSQGFMDALAQIKVDAAA